MAFVAQLVLPDWLDSDSLAWLGPDSLVPLGSLAPLVPLDWDFLAPLDWLDPDSLAPLDSLGLASTAYLVSRACLVSRA